MSANDTMPDTPDVPERAVQDILLFLHVMGGNLEPGDHESLAGLFQIAAQSGWTLVRGRTRTEWAVRHRADSIEDPRPRANEQDARMWAAADPPADIMARQVTEWAVVETVPGRMPTGDPNGGGHGR